MPEPPAATQSTQPPHPATEAASGPFIHRWNKLVSVTNWEKGRIIAEWRTALIDAGATTSDYSDEAWAARVGGVTGQHVGRLRRTHERFGAVHDDYPGLYWSHFQVALDWHDAEMWLEGAVQNRWSVSRMRTVRWETLGAPEHSKPRDDDLVVTELDEDAGGRHAGDADFDDPAQHDQLTAADSPSSHRAATGQAGENGQPTHPTDDAPPPDASAPPAPVRPFEKLPPLPDDVADAFEAFKLVILTHKLAGWSDFARDDLLACLDALKALAIQPAE